MTFINEYKNRGGRVTAGSDSGYMYNLYGFGYVQELELLREAGFQNARQAAAADLAARQGLGQFQTALGAGQRQLDQAKLAADQEAAREAAFADYTQLGLIGPQLASVIGGFPAATQVQSTPPPSATQQLLGLGIGAAGLAGALRRI